MGFNGETVAFMHSEEQPGKGAGSCAKCHRRLADARCPECDCDRPYCLRPQYADGLCKRHRDEHHYSMMRALEHRCHQGTRVLCRVDTDGDVLEGTALSGVRLVPRPGVPTRDRWPTVLVRVDGHFGAVEWRAIDLELA